MTFIQPEDYMSGITPKQLEKINKEMEAKKVMMKARMSGQDKVKDVLLNVAETFEDLGMYDHTDNFLQLVNRYEEAKLSSQVEGGVANFAGVNKVIDIIMWKTDLDKALYQLRKSYSISR